MSAVLLGLPACVAGAATTAAGLARGRPDLLPGQRPAVRRLRPRGPAGHGGRLWRRRDAGDGARCGPVRALEEERDFLLRSLEDLGRERAAGDLGEEDDRARRDDYTPRAAAVLRRLAAEGAEPPAAGAP